MEGRRGTRRGRPSSQSSASTPNAKKVRSRSRSLPSGLSGGSSSRSRSTGLSLTSRPEAGEGAELKGYHYECDHDKWGWMVSYSFRALLARLLVDTTEDKMQFQTDIQSCIKAVKLFTKHNKQDSVKVEEYECFTDAFLDSDLMMACISDACSHFHKDVTHIDLDSPLWKQVTTLIDNRKFQYHQDESIDGTVGWCRGKRRLGDGEGVATRDIDTSKAGRNKKTRDNKSTTHACEDASLLVTMLEMALVSDMVNGQGKGFVRELTKAVMQTLGVRDIYCDCPTMYHRCNTKIEMVAQDDTANWNRAYSIEPPEPTVLPSYADADVTDFQNPWQNKAAKTLPVQKASLVVPDVTWALPNFPGQFPLVVILKPGSCLVPGILQCYHEMLSKLYFQNAIFGLLLTPRLYVLLFAHKNEMTKKIKILMQNPIHFANRDTPWGFRSETFLQLTETLCKIMDWAGRMSVECK